MLELLSWTLSPTDSSLEKLLTLITASSPEKSCWGETSEQEAEQARLAAIGDTSPPPAAVDPARGRWRCVCSRDVSIGIRFAATESNGPGDRGVRRDATIDVSTMVTTTQGDQEIRYLQHPS
eukprot:COSAG02_NODE_5593_length_4202_cov_1.591031_2_plen_122_part_00